MNQIIKPLLLIEGINLTDLMSEYKFFFLGLLPSIFLVAILIEYFDQLEPLMLLKRTLISILLLTSVESFYASSINASFEAADSMIQDQKGKNIFLMDMFDANSHLEGLQDKEQKSFFKENGVLAGTFAFIKYHLFDSFVNDGFTVTAYFIAKLCFVIIKVVYSCVYYLGLGLFGIPCLLYILPKMGNILRGAIVSYLWCLIIPHILVFIISMIGTEINKGYMSGQIIGGSITGTSFLFVLTLFIAFTPLIGAMILSGSGISQAAGMIATMGANYVMNLPKKTVNSTAAMLGGQSLGPKSTLLRNVAMSGFNMAKGLKKDNPITKSNGNSMKEQPIPSDLSKKNSEAKSKSKLRPNDQTFGTRGEDSHTMKKQERFRSNRNVNSASEESMQPYGLKFQQKNQASSSMSLNQSRPKTIKQNQGAINGALPEHHKINRESQKTTHSYRRDRNLPALGGSGNRNLPRKRPSSKGL